MRLNIAGWIVFACVGFCVSMTASADTVVLKTGEEMKGLVVEEHHDRVVLSTVDGEKPVLRKDIEAVEYDDPAFSLLSVGLELERQEKFIEALSYFEKAAELNPDLTQARKAAIGIRSRLWAGFTEGPLSEIQKQQDIRDAWSASGEVDQEVRRKQKGDADLLWERLGVRLGREGDWVKASKVRLGSDAHKQGLRTGFLLVRLDGQSVRYLNAAAVTKKMLEPRFSSMILVVRQQMRPPASMTKTDLKSLGLRLKQAYENVIVNKVKRNSAAEEMGFKKKDQIAAVAGEQTRYLPVRRIEELIAAGGKDLLIVVDREIQISRK